MTENERDEMTRAIEGAPLPGDGPQLWKRESLSADDRYSLSAESLAHGLLVLCREDRTLLGGADEYGDNPRLWAAFKERWPDGDTWLGGVTGFQFGWAQNLVRVILGAAPVANPAIIEVDVPGAAPGGEDG